MKWIRFLRALLGFVYFFAWISAVGSLIYFFIAESSSDLPFNIGSNIVQNFHWTFYLVLALAVISQFVFVYMIFQMKKASWLITPNNFVREELVNHLKLAGISCLVGVLLNRVPSYIYSVFTRSQLDHSFKVKLAMNFGFSFDSMLVIISFGIFLIITSKIIKVSALIKQENDLTI